MCFSGWLTADELRINMAPQILIVDADMRSTMGRSGRNSIRALSTRTGAGSISERWSR